MINLHSVRLPCTLSYAWWHVTLSLPGPPCSLALRCTFTLLVLLQLGAFVRSVPVIQAKGALVSCILVLRAPVAHLLRAGSVIKAWAQECSTVIGLVPLLPLVLLIAVVHLRRATLDSDVSRNVRDSINARSGFVGRCC